MFRAIVFCCALSACLLFINAGSVAALTWPSSGSNLLPRESTQYALTSIAYKNRLYLAWRGSTDDRIFMANSPDGTHWTASYTPLPTDSIGILSGPRLGVIGGDVGMYLLWPGLNGGIFFSNSTDGQIWEPSRQILIVGGTDGTPYAPSLVYVDFENLYYLVWHATNSNGFYMTTSADLYYWKRSERILLNDESLTAPILFFNGQTLQLFWQGLDNHLWHAYSLLGTWSTSSRFLVNDFTPNGLSGCFFNGATLYITWKGIGSDSGIWISSSSDFGATWQPAQNIVTNDKTGAAVAITQFKQKLYIAYKSATSEAFYIAASQ